MGIVVGMLVAVAGTITFSGSVLETSPPQASNDVATIETVIFNLELDTFIRQRSILRRTYPQLIWTTDGCSAPIVGESGRSFNFRNACIRHDFGYRNYKAHGLFSTESRLRLDEQFRQDMYTLCGPKIRTFKVRCAAWAEIFYAAVRAGGGP
ncbi:MAG: phospholipase A2 [Ilumatobacteraceae bacterium]